MAAPGMKRVAPDPEQSIPVEVNMEFEELYSLHRKRVEYLCFKLMGQDPYVEDIVQEVFLQVFMKRSQFKGTATFTSWLHRLTINVIQQYWRRPAHTNRWRKSSLFEHSHLTTQPQLVLGMALVRAIESLPPGMRMVFKLLVIEGYSYEEAAEKLGRNVGTAKSQLHHAVNKMRAALS